MTPPNNDRMDRIERALEQQTEAMRRIDDRLDRLTGLHEALTQSVELMQRDWQERWTAISAALQQDAENMRALAHIAESHEQRLDDLEGKSQHRSSPARGQPSLS
jgi:conjugal transfer/entry exclusion protein